jgi:cytochrome c peroxidase
MRFSQLKRGVSLAVLAAAVGATVIIAQERPLQSALLPKVLSNEFPSINSNGMSATFVSQGSVDLTGEYFKAQGANGRSCATCHLPQSAWSITPETMQLLFAQSAGLNPIFNPLDANNPDHDLSTVQARQAGYSMMLTRGVFRRGGAPRADREWDVASVDDPNGYANPNRIVQWRRVMPTINFNLGSATVAWDGGNTMGVDQVAGLTNQATRNVTGAQQGQPATTDVINRILTFERSLSAAQLFSFGAGLLTADGARGGPQEFMQMTKTMGRFDLFDSWINHPMESRAQVARGQELFNSTNSGNGRSCNGCHNSANNGTNFNDLLFDIRTASAEARTPDLPLYTIRNRTTGEQRQLTDTGQGNVTGLWGDLGKFKTPTLRALSARAPYFHNGIAMTLEDVVRHYERHLNFVFSKQQREDLVAFLRVL